MLHLQNPVYYGFFSDVAIRKLDDFMAFSGMKNGSQHPSLQVVQEI